MTSFLFWNVYGKDLSASLSRLVAAHEVDVLILSECCQDFGELARSLEGGPSSSFCHHFAESSKVQIFSRLPDKPLIPIFGNQAKGISIRRLRIPGATDILLAAVHLPSKRNTNVREQEFTARELATEIRRVEAETNINRTIVVGDLNMNPFEPGLTMADALHAVATKGLAKRVTRQVGGKPYPFFYNPMWGLLGDRTVGPPGTYYFHSSSPENLYWQMYDQVLLRPSLMHCLVELRILDHDGEDPLTTRGGLPHRSRYSDHLPIWFLLDLHRRSID